MHDKSFHSGRKEGRVEKEWKEEKEEEEKSKNRKRVKKGNGGGGGWEGKREEGLGRWGWSKGGWKTMT